MRIWSQGGQITCERGSKSVTAKIVKDGNSYHVFEDAVVIVNGQTLLYRLSPMRTQAKCIYLGDPIQRDGVTITVKCHCNGKEFERMHVAHRCEIHRRCLPTLVPKDMADWKARLPESDIYHLCHGCGDRQSTPTTTPTSPAD